MKVFGRRKCYTFPKMRMRSGEEFSVNEKRLTIPLDRLDSCDFELGLAHELTEQTLKGLVADMVKRYDMLTFLVLMHEATVLSIGWYPAIEDQYGRIEAKYK